MSFASLTRRRPGAARVALVAALASIALVPARPARAAGPPARPDSARAGAVHGYVVDAATGQPVPGAQVRIPALGRGDVSHADGEFHLDGLSPGAYTVTAERIGYRRAHAEVTVLDGDTVEVRLELTSSALQVAGLVATGTGRLRAADEVARPASVVSGSELRRQLGASVTATVAGEAGISQRYNGPAASQPVIRGMGGDRVLVLEDGQRTGDLAGSAADHGVMVDPLTAERVEVLRGPAGLLHGSNALGGVINVVREDIPRSLPDRLTGVASLQGESAIDGLAGGGMVLTRVGPLAVRGEAVLRRAGDTRTPLGDLPFTDMEGHSLGLGVSSVGEAGYAGVAVRDYALVYGVPSVFGGQTIPGGHEFGVDVDVRRTAVRGEAALLTGWKGFSSIELDGGYTRFDQEEVEFAEDGSRFEGTTFLQHLGTFRLVARHGHRPGSLLRGGALGVTGSVRSLFTGGLTSGSRDARQWTGAVFAYEELETGRLLLELGARGELTRIDPLDDASVQGVPVRTRDFATAAGSAAAVWHLGGPWRVGARLARSVRTPGVEELFSRGPHLASYSYEIGNPSLGAESGLGADLFARYTGAGVKAEATVFRNAVDGFIHYVPTGEMDPRFGRYPVYQAIGEDATFVGAEAEVRWEPLTSWVVEATGSWVRAETAAGQPLPAIPPAHGALRLRRDVPRWFAEVGVEGSARQDRVDRFEEPTAAYLLMNAGAGVRWTVGGALHSVTLQADNVTDRVWRDHLSRIKEVAPQPGLNLRLLYRVDF